MVNTLGTLNFKETMVPMTECYGTNELENVSSWTLSLRLRKLVNCPEATPAANYLLRTRDLYMFPDEK